MAKKRQLTCSCCGGAAGKFEQWPNRDTGFGICRKCFDWIAPRDTPQEMRSRYGVEGVHYAAKDAK